MTPEENDIVSRIKKGDHSAESELFTDYRDKIVTIVQVRLGEDNPDWEDICCEIQTAILIKLREGKFDPEKGPLYAYIYGIALNKLKDYYKSEKKRKHIFQNQPTVDISNENEKKAEEEKQELQRIMKNSINSLKNKYKEVIYLRFYEGLSVSEISDRLQLEPRRVSERIHYAIKLMHKKCTKLNFFSIFRNHLLIYVQKGHTYEL